MDRRDEMINECDEMTLQLKIALKALIEAKWSSDRRGFLEKKGLVVMLLKTLIKDVKSIRYKN